MICHSCGVNLEVDDLYWSRERRVYCLRHCPWAEGQEPPPTTPKVIARIGRQRALAAREKETARAA